MIRFSLKPPFTAEIHRLVEGCRILEVIAIRISDRLVPEIDSIPKSRTSIIVDVFNRENMFISFNDGTYYVHAVIRYINSIFQ